MEGRIMFINVDNKLININQISYIEMKHYQGNKTIYVYLSSGEWICLKGTDARRLLKALDEI